MLKYLYMLRMSAKYIMILKTVLFFTNKFFLNLVHLIVHSTT